MPGSGGDWWYSGAVCFAGQSRTETLIMHAHNKNIRGLYSTTWPENIVCVCDQHLSQIILYHNNNKDSKTPKHHHVYCTYKIFTIIIFFSYEKLFIMKADW